MRTPRLAGPDFDVMRCFNGEPLSTAEVLEAVRVCGGGGQLSYQQASRILRLLATRGYLWAWREPDGRRCWKATDAGHAAVAAVAQHQ